MKHRGDVGMGVRRRVQGSGSTNHPSARRFRIGAAFFALPLLLLATAAQASNPIVIKTVAELQNIEKNLAADYELANDIDASATKSWNGGAGFLPLGAYPHKPFTGSLNGAGHTISDLTISSSDT